MTERFNGFDRKKLDGWVNPITRPPLFGKRFSRPQSQRSPISSWKAIRRGRPHFPLYSQECTMEAHYGTLDRDLNSSHHDHACFPMAIFVNAAESRGFHSQVALVRIHLWCCPDRQPGLGTRVVSGAPRREGVAGCAEHRGLDEGRRTVDASPGVGHSRCLLASSAKRR